MTIKVRRKKDWFLLDMPPYLANDKKYLEKHGLCLDPGTDEVKKPPIQPVVDAKIELEKEIISHKEKDPAKVGRKNKK